MSFKALLKGIESSETFKSFMEKHPDAELCAGFFVLDFLSNDAKETLDYKTGDKVFTFELKKSGVGITEDKLLDVPGKPKLEKISPDIKTETEELKGIAGMQALENGISAQFNKIIAILQRYTNEKNSQKIQVWNLTCMLEGLIILHILIDTETGEVIKFERKSMMDMIRRIK